MTFGKSFSYEWLPQTEPEVVVLLNSYENNCPLLRVNSVPSLVSVVLILLIISRCINALHGGFISVSERVIFLMLQS